ncbi:DNA polymerase III subunit delta [bacterium]|nr:DNA polymerase III subunit delta [bacterium]
MARKGGTRLPGFEELRNGPLRTGEFAPVYVLVGEDHLRIEAVVEAMRARILDPASESFNFHVLHGDQVGWSEVLQAAQGLTMFGGRQLVWVKQIEALDRSKDDPGLAAWQQYLASPNDTAVLVLTGDKVDGRKAWVQQARKQGYLHAFDAPSGRSLIAWIAKAADRAGLMLDAEGQRVLADLIGSDLQALKGEIDKLSLVAESRGRALTADELPGLVMDQAQLQVFEMTNAIADADPTEVMQTWWRLKTWGQDVYALTPLVMAHLRRTAMIAAALEAGDAPGDVARIANLNSWAAGKYLEPHARRLGGAASGVLGACHRCERTQKSRPLPPETAFEQLLLEITLDQPTRGPRSTRS